MPDFEPLPRTEPTMISGYRAEDDLDSKRVVLGMDDTILRIMPEATPFLTLTGKIKGKKVIKNKKLEWLEKDFKPRKVTISGAQTDVDTSIEVVAGDGAKLAANDLVRNLRTNEIFLVSSMSTDTATVVRAIGENGVAMVDGDVCVVLASSYPDNATIGTMKSIAETPNYNYAQIFRTPFGFSGRDIVTELYGGDDVTTETKWQAVEHKRSIEYAAMFGKRHIIAGSGSTKARTMMGGLASFIQSNVWNVGGVEPSFRTFCEFAEEGMRWGRGGYLQSGGTKYLLHSARWGTVISGWGEQKLQYETLDDEVGFGAMSIKTAHGKIFLLHSPILDEYFPDYAFLVDFNHTDYCPMQGRDTKLLRGREENDRDGEAYEYFTDAGVRWQFEQAHSLLKGLSV